METLWALGVAAAGLVIGSVCNRLVVREPGYVITDPADLPEDADPSLLDELAPAPDPPPRVPLLAVSRPWRPGHMAYAAVEIATAVAAGLAVAGLGAGWSVVPVLVVVPAFVTLAAVDFRVYRIPDRINFPAIALTAVSIVVASLVIGRPGAIVGAGLGGVLYSGILALAHVISPRGMGWGDVKLGWTMGLVLGWMGWEEGAVAEQVVTVVRPVLLGLLLGSILGVLFGGLYAIVRRSTRAVFPYGPSLVLGCYVALFRIADLA